MNHLSSRALGITIVVLMVLISGYGRSIANTPDDVWKWQDTDRTAKGSSRPTKNNDTVRYSSDACPAASDDGKWCADVVEVVVKIDNTDDPEELYRLKYFPETSENCRTHVRIDSGPNGWASTIDCKFDPSLRRFVLHEKGWTSPQVFTSEITIQERVPAKNK